MPVIAPVPARRKFTSTIRISSTYSRVSAELIVGGEVIDPHALSAGEIRGSRIDGGELRTIAQGDVVTIPRGVPHWFKQVSTPFTYYVIKSTHNG